jgi:predicted AAA+ superfamily ATPase
MLTRLLKLPRSQSCFLFGPRQVGKTTLVEATLPARATRTYDLLRTDEYMRLASRPSLLREEILHRPSAVKHVFIDEIQRIPDLLNEVQVVMEADRPPHFVLSGSSARKLKRAQANLLGGRAWTLRLYPLTHVELGAEFDLAKALEVGTLPKVYLEGSRESANQLLRSYVETYLKEEVEAEALVRSSGPFLRFLFHAGHESGRLINYSAIARDTGTSHATVKEYFKILEDTLVGTFLFPFHKSQRKRLAQHPKFYIFDTGVERALTRKLSLRLEEGTRDYGEAFEHWVINETIRLGAYGNKDFELSHFRTERGAEVDLVIEPPRGGVIAVEVKSGRDPRSAEFQPGFEALAEITKPRRTICVSRAPHPRKVGSTDVLPWREYFELLRSL